MAVRRSSKESTKTQERMRNKKREEEEEYEDIEEEEESSKSSSKRNQAADEVEEEADDIPRYNGKQMRSLRLTPDWLSEEGTYTFKVKSAKYMPPRDEQLGQVVANLSVVEAPENASEPEDGWPTIGARFMVKLGSKRDEKSIQRVQIGNREFSLFVFACIGELDPDEEQSVEEICSELKGSEVTAQVVHSKDGYQNLRRWASVE